MSLAILRMIIAPLHAQQLEGSFARGDRNTYVPAAERCLLYLICCHCHPFFAVRVVASRVRTKTPYDSNNTALCLRKGREGTHQQNYEMYLFVVQPIRGGSPDAYSTQPSDPIAKSALCWHEVLVRVNTSACLGDTVSNLGRLSARLGGTRRTTRGSFEGPPLFGWRTTHLVLHEQLTVPSG